MTGCVGINLLLIAVLDKQDEGWRPSITVKNILTGIQVSCKSLSNVRCNLWRFPILHHILKDSARCTGSVGRPKPQEPSTGRGVHDVHPAEGRVQAASEAAGAQKPSPVLTRLTRLPCLLNVMLETIIDQAISNNLLDWVHHTAPFLVLVLHGALFMDAPSRD